MTLGKDEISRDAPTPPPRAQAFTEVAVFLDTPACPVLLLKPEPCCACYNIALIPWVNRTPNRPHPRKQCAPPLLTLPQVDVSWSSSVARGGLHGPSLHAMIACIQHSVHTCRAWGSLRGFIYGVHVYGMQLTGTLLPLCRSLCPCVPAVLLFVSSAAYTVTNLRDELGDILAGDDTLTDLTIAGFGLGELQERGACVW
jgi:hypothetical protein